METVKRLLGLEELQAKHMRLTEELNTLRSRDLSLALSRWIDAKLAAEGMADRLRREEKTFDELNKQLSNTKEEIVRLEGEILRFQGEAAPQWATIASYQNECNRLKSEIPRLEQQLVESYRRIECFKAELKRLEKLENELRGRKEALEREAAKIQAEICELENQLKKEVKNP